MSATLDAANLQRLTLTIPAVGAWVAECQTDAAPPTVGARCVLTVLGVEYLGTCVHRGEFAGQGGARIVGGAAAWGTVLPARGYHSDAGVKARAVVEDLARATGETLGTWGGPGVIGADFARPTGEASRSLSAALQGGPWYVGADGLTHCAHRPAGAMVAHVLEWDPVASVVTLAPETSLAGVAPGLTIADERLPATVGTAREIRVEIGGSTVRVTAWCPDVAAGKGRIASALTEIVANSQPLRLWGIYRYRVFRMAGDRVEAQSASKLSGVPDVVPVTAWPGVAGAWADLTMGSEILIQFIDGDPTQPVVTGFAPKGTNGFVPTSLSLCDGTAPVARAGDTVMVFPAGATFSAIVPPAVSPVSITIVSSSVMTGVIRGGSQKVKA